VTRGIVLAEVRFGLHDPAAGDPFAGFNPQNGTEQVARDLLGITIVERTRKGLAAARAPRGARGRGGNALEPSPPSGAAVAAGVEALFLRAPRFRRGFAAAPALLEAVAPSAAEPSPDEAVEALGDEDAAARGEASDGEALSVAPAVEDAATLRPRDVDLAAVFAAFFVAFFAVVFVAFFVVALFVRLRVAGVFAPAASSSLAAGATLTSASRAAEADGFGAVGDSTTPSASSSGGTSAGRPPGRPPRDRIPLRSDAAPAALRAAWLGSGACSVSASDCAAASISEAGATS
jgi:hypothetical protein